MLWWKPYKRAWFSSHENYHVGWTIEDHTRCAVLILICAHWRQYMFVGHLKSGCLCALEFNTLFVHEICRHQNTKHLNVWPTNIPLLIKRDNVLGYNDLCFYMYCSMAKMWEWATQLTHQCQACIRTMPHSIIPHQITLTQAITHQNDAALRQLPTWTTPHQDGPPPGQLPTWTTPYTSIISPPWQFPSRATNYQDN